MKHFVASITASPPRIPFLTFALLGYLSQREEEGLHCKAKFCSTTSTLSLYSTLLKTPIYCRVFDKQGLCVASLLLGGRFRGAGLLPRHRKRLHKSETFHCFGLTSLPPLPKRGGGAALQSQNFVLPYQLYLSTQHFRRLRFIAEFSISKGCVLQVSPLGGDLEGASLSPRHRKRLHKREAFHCFNHSFFHS